jgi:predicted nucleic acid-binding protein
MGFLDTNVIVRYLVGEPPGEARRAAQIIDIQPDLQVTDVTIHETAYVLTSQYRATRVEAIDYLVAFLQKNNISVFNLEKNTVIQALLLCRPSARVSFGDALIWAAARSSSDRTVYSFDRRFPEDGIELREP